MVAIWVRHFDIADSATKQVTCEHCAAQFSYPLSRRVVLDVPIVFPGITAYGLRTAQRLLAQKLQRDVEPTPCQSCGYIQANMSRELRRRFLGKLRTIGTYITLPFLALDFCIAAGWLYARFCMLPNQRPDVDWLLIIMIVLAGAALGVLLMGVRQLLSIFRYPGHGFMPLNQHSPSPASLVSPLRFS